MISFIFINNHIHNHIHNGNGNGNGIGIGSLLFDFKIWFLTIENHHIHNLVREHSFLYMLLFVC